MKHITMDKEKAMVEPLELPKYRCHKEVWALKIESVQLVAIADEDDGMLHNHTRLCFEDKNYSPIQVPDSYVARHDPKPGGYYVVYADGYKSFSPADAFEDGYALIIYQTGAK